MNFSKKNFVKNTFFTTGITLVLLACIAAMFGGTCIFVRTIIEALAANCCIHLGFQVTKRFESGFFLLDTAVDIGVSAGILMAFGACFGWFSSTPPWVLVLMLLVTYGVSTALQVFRVRGDLRFINEKLRQRAAKKGD